jgi:glycerol-3-phosphate O-acyltransferase
MRSGDNLTVQYASTPVESTANTLLWVSLDDPETLMRILATNPAQRFVTFNIFERRGPTRAHPRHGVSALRLLEIILRASKLIITFGAPLSPDLQLDNHNPQRLVLRLQRKLKLDFFRNLKVVRGIPFQPIATQERMALSGADYDRELIAIASEMRTSTARIHHLAKREFRAIAANPIAPLYTLGSKICGMMLRRLFRNITVNGLNDLAATAKNNTVVLVPMHRSHFDYIVLGQKLYEANMIPPIVAAGVNLSFWPIGFVIRGLGAYFVRRDSRSNRIHGLVLRRYVTALVKRGHLQEFFIEGGRSRSGKMRTPKVGLLSVIVEAFRKGVKRDVMFVPVSITYEHVVEDSAFGDENTGKSKRRENLLELIRARSIFKNRYGDIVISFGAPMSLMQEIEPGPRTERIEPQDPRAFVQGFARLLTVRIRAQTSVSLTALAHTALLSATQYALSSSDLSRAIRNLARIACQGREMDSSLGDITPTLNAFLRDESRDLKEFHRGEIISTHKLLNEDVFFVPGQHRYTADFYKNTILHRFFALGAISLLQLKDGKIKPAAASQLRDIFAEDLLLPDARRFQDEILAWCRELEKKGILLQLDLDEFEFTREEPGLFIPHLLTAPIESILWCLEIVRALSSELSQPEHQNPPLAVVSIIKKAQEEFKTARYRGLVSRTEAASQSALQSALEILAAREIITLENTGDKGQVARMNQAASDDLDYLKSCHRALIRHARQDG